MINKRPRLDIKKLCENYVNVKKQLKDVKSHFRISLLINIISIGIIVILLFTLCFKGTKVEAEVVELSPIPEMNTPNEFEIVEVSLPPLPNIVVK